MLINRPRQKDHEGDLRKYFAPAIEKPSSLGSIILIGIGFVIALSAFLSSASNGGDWTTMTILPLIVGLVLAGGGGLYLASLHSTYRQRCEEVQPQPSDSQVQQWLDEDLQQIINHSCRALSLSEEDSSRSEPLVILTPILVRSQGSDLDWTLWRRGEDRVLRFGYYRLIVIRLTERHLASYICDYNFVRNVALNERTSEFHYRDVVSVTTEEWSDPADLPTGLKLTTRQDFVLTVPSGEAIRVSVDVAQIREITGEEQPPALGADSAVRQIRSELRGYKTLSAAA